MHASRAPHPAAASSHVVHSPCERQYFEAVEVLAHKRSRQSARVMPVVFVYEMDSRLQVII